MPRIGELVQPSSRVLIAFDDPTVPSYGSIRRLAVEGVLAELAARGVAEEQSTLVCANALHRKWTHDELAAGLGEEVVRRFAKRLTCHDAQDSSCLLARLPRDAAFNRW
jgi:nickel-dependent lactate racemase